MSGTHGTDKPEYNSSFKRLGTKYVLSVMAACVAESVTYPLDLTKTRLQIQCKLYYIYIYIYIYIYYFVYVVYLYLYTKLMSKFCR